MDGLSPNRRQARGHYFASQLVDAGSTQSSAWFDARLGPFGLRIGYRTQDALCELILGAFMQQRSANAEFRLSIVRAHEMPRLPPMEWASPWTNAGRVVPEEITYPYRVFIDRTTGIAYALDQQRGVGTVWIRRNGELDLRSFLTPFRLILSWMSNLRDAEIVHGSGAVINGQGMAFSGASGSGKSTLAIACGILGEQAISDDCLLLYKNTMFAVYSRAKLTQHSLALIGGPSIPTSALAHSRGAKEYFRLQSLGTGYVSSHALHRWCFPIIDKRSAAYVLTKRRAYRMLSVDSLREVFGGGVRNRIRLAHEVAKRPCTRLMISESMPDNLALLRALPSSQPGMPIAASNWNGEPDE